MSKLENLTPIQFRQIKCLMSYQIDSQAMHFSGGFNRNRYLIDNKGVFPTGLLYIAKNWIIEHKIPIKLEETRVKPTKNCNFKLNLKVNPYPEQLEAAKTSYNANRGIITAPTGSGKSIMISLLINELQVRTMVVVPTLALKRQLTDSLTEAFGKEIVGELGHAIAVENIDALDVKDVITDYNAVIIDEFHHAAANTYKKLNKKAWVNIYHRYGFTATPFRSKDEEKLLLESVLSQVVYRLDYKTAVEKGYIVPVEFFYLDLPKVKISDQIYTYAQVYAYLVVNNKARNDAVHEILSKFHANNLSTLCLVKEIEHGRILSKDFHFIHGENEDNKRILELMNLNLIKTVIGTNGCIGEGVDTRPTEYVVIAGLGKSKNAFMQQCGRGMRRYPGKESCKVILFRDRSHKFTLRHFNAQCKIAVEEYGCRPIKLEIL